MWCYFKLFFALKSLTIMFPLSILYLRSGILFTPFIAVMVSMVGLTTTITIPYWIGRYSGEDIIQYIGTRYPKVQQLTGYQNENAFLYALLPELLDFCQVTLWACILALVEWNSLLIWQRNKRFFAQYCYYYFAWN